MKETAMMPQQPFWVISSKYFKVYTVLHDGISHFYTFKAKKNTRDELLIVPDLSIDILFCCDKENPEAFYCGPVRQTRKHKNVTFRENKTYFGVRFEPCISVCRISDVVEEELDIEIILGDREMVYRICTAESFMDRVKIFMQYYIGQCGQYRESEKYKTIQIMLNQMILKNGNCKVQDLSSATYYSVRHINQIFQDEVGITPKTIAKTIRFQHAIRELSDEGRSLTEIANHLGYYDEAHMIHEFKLNAGITPGNYQKIIRKNYKIEYMK